MHTRMVVVSNRCLEVQPSLGASINQALYFSPLFRGIGSSRDIMDTRDSLREHRMINPHDFQLIFISWLVIFESLDGRSKTQVASPERTR